MHVVDPRLQFLSLLFSLTLSIRVTDPQLPGEDNVTTGEVSRVLGSLSVSVTAPNADESEQQPQSAASSKTQRESRNALDPQPREGRHAMTQLLQSEAAASRSEGMVSREMSHNVSSVNLEEFIQQLKTFIRPDEKGHYRGSAKWARRVLRVVAELVSNQSHGGAQGAGTRDGKGGQTEEDQAPLQRLVKEGSDEKFAFDLDTLGGLAPHSVVAQQLYASRMLHLRGLEELQAGNVMEAVQYLAAALRLDDLPSSWPAICLEPATRRLEALVESGLDTGMFADTCLVLSHLYLLGKKSPSELLVKLRRGQQAAPEDEALFYMEGNLLNTLGDYNASAAALERSIQLGSHKALFIHGFVMEKLNATQRARNSFENYILRASPEERKVCEAYFHLAVLDICDSDPVAAKRNYYDGLRARENRLLCYKDEKSQHQRWAEACFWGERPCGNPACTESGKRMCPCHQMYYCSEECQKGHWKHHKQDCQYVKKKNCTASAD